MNKQKRFLRSRICVNWQLKKSIALDNKILRYVIETWDGDTRRFWLLCAFGVGNLDIAERLN